jgi:hypothetical protein
MKVIPETRRWRVLFHIVPFMSGMIKLTPCLSEIKFLDNYLMICRIVPKNIYSFGIKLFYLILEVTAMGIKTISVSR